MSFYISDLLLFPSIVQGVLIALILYRRTENKHINRLLAILMICSAFMLTGRMVYDRFPENWMFQLAFIPDIVIYLFGPVTYLFISQLLGIKRGLYSYLHFVPAAIYFLMIIHFFTLGSSYFDQLVTTVAIWDLIFGIELTGLIANISYTAICIILVKRHRSGEKQNITYQHPISTFLRNYLAAIVICEVLWFFSFIGSYYLSISSSIVNYTVIWYSMPFASYLVGYYMLANPPILLWTISSEKKSNTRLPSDIVNQLKAKLDHLIEKQEVYRKEELTLTDLSHSLQTSANNLSWLLNEVYQRSFYEFINEQRIRAFVTSLEKGEHHRKTILGLALEVGFKSKSTFNKSFKAIHDDTPSKFIKEKFPLEKVQLRHSA